ncbi:MAG: helix-turn-helix transcriptional regulator [Anaerolineae bacterium]|nr:helix-turn-helix transcriptional regulator [Anaerolineae bacterium]
MSFIYEDRPSESLFVRNIWHTQTEEDGTFLSPADSSWDIMINRVGDSTQVSLFGPSSRAGDVPYQAGTETIGIQFRLGTYMPRLPTNTILDLAQLLPQASRGSFWFNDRTWEVPNFDNVEVFIEKMVRNRLLAQDNIVDALLQEQMPDRSLRSVQRHFQRTTGLTQNYVRQIERAHQAATLLQQGTSILDAVYALGYADQPHLTRSLTRLIGQTPAQIIRQNKPE